MLKDIKTIDTILQKFEEPDRATFIKEEVQKMFDKFSENGSGIISYYFKKDDENTWGKILLLTEVLLENNNFNLGIFYLSEYVVVRGDYTTFYTLQRNYKDMYKKIFKGDTTNG